MGFVESVEAIRRGHRKYRLHVPLFALESQKRPVPVGDRKP